MSRPAKIDEPTKTYTLLMKTSQYEKLAKISEEQQKLSLGQFAVADVMREAIDIYISAYEEEMSDESQTQIPRMDVVTRLEAGALGQTRTENLDLSVENPPMGPAA